MNKIHQPTQLATVMVGIPAYNEEQNISFIVQDVLKQKQTNYRLEKLVVISDGSTDSTVQKATTAGSSVQVIENTKRKGLAATQNQLIEMCNSTILVLLNADTYIKENNFIATLIQPIIQDQKDLVTANLCFLPGKNKVESALTVSMKFKKEIFEKYHNGRNIYTCHGPARAFSKRFYKNFRFDNSIGEDAYSYLYAISHQYQYDYLSGARIYVRSPNTYTDYKKQSLRFRQSKMILTKCFGKELMKHEYRLPIMLSLFTLIKYLFSYPKAMVLYLLLLVRTKLSLNTKSNDVWQTAASSKTVR